MHLRFLFVAGWIALFFVCSVNAQEGRDKTPIPPKKLGTFVAWATTKGIDTSKLAIRATDEKGYGVFAKSPVSKGSILLTLPPKARFRFPNLDPLLKEMINVFNDASLTKIDPTTTLAIGLLYEAGQVDSPWKPWIDIGVLPSELDSVLFWSPKELQFIATTPLFGIRHELMENINSVYSSVVTPFVESFENELVGLDFTLQAFQRAAILVQTRALHRSPKNGLSLLPFIDFLNHDSEPNAVVVASGKDILVKATRSLTAGSEILISYDDNPSHVMMLLYGFADLHNKFDYYPIRLHIRAKDIDLPRRKLLLRRRGLGSERHEYRIYADTPFIEDDLMYAARVIAADEKELTVLEEKSSRLEDGQVDDLPISARNEANARNKLKRMLFDLSEVEDGWQEKLDKLAEEQAYSFRSKHGVIYFWQSRAALVQALRYITELEEGTWSPVDASKSGSKARKGNEAPKGAAQENPGNGDYEENDEL